MFTITHMGLTETHVETLLAVPAETFRDMTKDRVGGGRNIRWIRRRMTAAQGGLCVKCGGVLGVDPKDPRERTDESPELSHTVPASWHDGEGATGGDRYGFLKTGGQMSVWHRGCNRQHGERLTRVSDFDRPDLVWVGDWSDLPTIPRD